MTLAYPEYGVGAIVTFIQIQVEQVSFFEETGLCDWIWIWILNQHIYLFYRAPISGKHTSSEAELVNDILLLLLKPDLHFTSIMKQTFTATRHSNENIDEHTKIKDIDIWHLVLFYAL